jgi:hypothetical protein
MNVLTAAGAKSHRVTRCLSDDSRWAIPLRDVWELNECSMSRHQETTMPKYLLHDEYTPHELDGGR